MAPGDPLTRRRGDLAQEARLWSARLSREVGRPVEVAFGRARRNVIVARSRGERLEVRLNAGFTEAPREVREALGAWLKNGKRARRACATLDAWIAELAERLGPPSPRGVTIRARGKHHDLAEIAREVLAREFADELPAELERRVTWGRRATRPARRSMQLGSYEAERNLVRIHPILDQPAVPRYFVRYVVFHELLHAALSDLDERRAQRSAGRRVAHHGPEFKRREAAYRDCERAFEWQAKHLPALFRSARSGKPMRAAGTKRSVRAAVQGWLFPD